MALDFPSSPTVGQVFTVSNATWTWDGVKWTAIGSPVVTIGDNRIINGNFAVNQRTYVTSTALATTVYGHDRWKAGPSGCTYTFTAALPDTTITITANTLTQVIEAGWIEGGVYTLSWTGTAQARVYQGTPTGSYAASPVVTAALTVGTNTIVEFNTGTVGKVKFENGSVATPFNRQSLAKSLVDCQRYCWVWSTGLTNATLAAGAPPTTAEFRGIVTFPVPMRAAPTVTLSAASTWAAITGASALTSSAVTANSITSSGFYLSLTVTGATVGLGGYVRDATGAAKLTVEAEL